MGYSIWEIAKAFIDDHSELTADLYTQAIVIDPNNSELYSDRTRPTSNPTISLVQTLTNRKEEFLKLLESYKPSLVYLQGEQLENDEVGSCVWRDADLPTAESISNIFPHCLQFVIICAEEENLNEVWKKEVETVFESHGLSCELNWDECKMTVTATERTLFTGVHVLSVFWHVVLALNGW
ncbi:uncharacterized protein LOC133709459 [Rosa rugosa]|uniref:uncharacterized protein LOC133709459 n=1 Tax=Rosa rugosa TaxID=74645 RepID=UPI002B40B73C|nr:uncharacterized protein LOC133709459 [Rosa rugosa]XP_061991193.1 uncharacterized protein LOC133709459 [Rosa rugosa]XP_061991194.1 uncharacterized protein LOC133709459 [Rosa rugosa]XP_061991195.1 uncharacterized protein LOC133709459 [Rosa rugosa]